MICEEEVNVVLRLNLDGDEYSIKPIMVKELISRINVVIRKKENILRRTFNKYKEKRRIITVIIIKELIDHTDDNGRIEIAM